VIAIEDSDYDMGVMAAGDSDHALEIGAEDADHLMQVAAEDSDPKKFF